MKCMFLSYHIKRILCVKPRPPMRDNYYLVFLGLIFMKRLFGLIGFTFLFVLSAVFYSDFNEIVFAILLQDFSRVVVQIVFFAFMISD